MKIVTNVKELEPGRWYAVALSEDDGTFNWGGAPLYKYEGDGCWTADDGEPAGLMWDPVLQIPVEVSSAEAFMLQN